MSEEWYRCWLALAVSWLCLATVLLLSLSCRAALTVGNSVRSVLSVVMMDVSLTCKATGLPAATSMEIFTELRLNMMGFICSNKICRAQRKRATAFQQQSHSLTPHWNQVLIKCDDCFHLGTSVLTTHHTCDAGGTSTCFTLRIAT